MSGVVLLLWACASQKPVEDVEAGAEKPGGVALKAEPSPTPDLFGGLPVGGAIDRLRVRAGVQEGSPIGDRVAPAWLGESEQIPDEMFEHAAAPLEVVIGPIRAAPRTSPAAEDFEQPSAADREQAMRLYARGRLARANEETAEALSALEAASRLDPGSFEVWRALGDAQMAAGLRSSGLRSFQIAAERGLDDVRAWALIGLEAVRRRDTDNALRWLVAARDGLLTGADPIAIAWIEVALGELVLELGRERAGAELLRSALSRPIEDASRSTFQGEYATLVRRRPQLWLRVGDAEALVGDWAGAADAYDRATAETTSELADAVSQRQTAVLVAGGFTARATLSVLDRVRRAGGRVGHDDLRTLRLLGPKEPDLSPAIAQLASTLAIDSESVRSRLLLARFAAASGPMSIDAIDRDALLRTAHVIELLRPIGTDSARWEFARALTERQPSGADAIADALFAGGMIRGTELVPLSAGSDLLSRRVRLAMRMPDRTIALTGDASDPELLIAEIETATRLGRWDEADVLLAEAERIGGGIAVRALEAASRFDRAFDAWSDAFGQSESVEMLLVGARLGLACDLRNEAAEILLAAHGLDPADDRVYALMLDALRGAGAFDNRASIEEALGTLRANAPDGPTLEALDIAQVLQRGFTAEGHERARLLVDRIAAPKLADFGVLLTIWNQASERGDGELLADAERWLERGLDEERPTEARAVALARVMALRTSAEDARAFLASLPLAPTKTIVVVESELLRQSGREDEAFALLGDLYDHPTLSVGDTVRLALLELDQQGALDVSIDRMGSIPRHIRVRPEDLPSLVGLCNALMSRMIEQPAGSERLVPLGLQYASVAGLAIDMGASLPEPYHRVRLRALAQAAETPFEQILRATEQMHSAIGNVSQGAFEDVFGLLIQRSRTQKALLWAAEVSMLGDGLDEEYWPFAANRLAWLGTIETVEAVMARLEERGMLVAAQRAVSGTPEGGEDSPVNVRAELVYGLAGIASFADRNLQAKELYRLALRLEPTHPWVCNDYGYMLVDRDEELEEAERLLMIAYDALPEQMNVLDSVGWLRYRQGRFVGPDGAVALLERAVAAAEGEASATILNHLGDARWMVGDVEGAAQMWEQAEVLFFRDVRAWNSPELQQHPMYGKTQARLGNIRDKLRMLEIEGRDPPVARTRGTRVEPNE